jgi:tRNA-modifying protein YgfZ
MTTSPGMIEHGTTEHGTTEIAHLSGRRVLAVSGEDRVSYLQGLVSNDVALAAPGRAVWAALLTPQGKWLADFFVTADAERLLLDVDAGQAEMLATRLMRFRLRAKVAVETTSLPVHAGWPGPAPAGAWPDPRLEAAGWRSFAPLTATVDEAAYDRHRLSLGLPDGPRDLEAEKTVLLEAGFDELNGVSWTKGCYMGQELTARTKYRGLVKRRLMPVTVAGALPAPGTPVLRDGTEVGAMRSGRDGTGLALLRLDAGPGPFACGEAVLTPARPGWMHAAA